MVFASTTAVCRDANKTKKKSFIFFEKLSDRRTRNDTRAHAMTTKEPTDEDGARRRRLPTSVAENAASNRRTKRQNVTETTSENEGKENAIGKTIGKSVGTNADDDAMEDARYDGEIVIANTAKELDAAIDRIRNFCAETSGVNDDDKQRRCAHCGFDMEWRVMFKKGAPEAKTSLVQIAAANADLSESLVVLGRIHTTGLTKKFKAWIRDETRGKTGLNVRGDASKLKRDFGLVTSRVIELATLANERFGGCPSGPSWSLARLCEHVLGKNLPKDKTRMSNWEREELNENQIKYAAMDAWASLLVYRALMERDVVHLMGDEPYAHDPLPDPVESSDDDESSDEDESLDEDVALEDEDEDIALEEENANCERGDDKGELSPQSRNAPESIELTDEQRAAYERHMSGLSVDAIAEATSAESTVVFEHLVTAMRKGCSFYFDLLSIPDHLKLFFDDHVTLNGGGVPKVSDFVNHAQLERRRATLTLVALTVKLARDREFGVAIA